MTIHDPQLVDVFNGKFVGKYTSPVDCMGFWSFGNGLRQH